MGGTVLDMFTLDATLEPRAPAFYLFILFQ